MFFHFHYCWSTLIAFASIIGHVIAYSCSENAITLEDIQNSFEASKAVYDKNIEEGRILPRSRFEVKFDEEKVTDNEYTVRVIIAEKQFTTIIAIRGMDSDGNELPKLVTEEIKAFNTTPVVFGGTLVAVNTIFWKAFKPIYKIIKAKIQDQARKYLVTGHSFGGAVASLLAITAKEDEGRMWENPGSSLITFGQPRVGNKEFAEKHDQLISPMRKLRFVMGLDPVPHIPLWPYAVHHSREIWIAKRDILFKPSWFWKICGAVDPLKCSNMWTFKPDIQDHEIRSYEQHVMNPPPIFYDKSSAQHESWKNAMKHTCQILEET